MSELLDPLMGGSIDINSARSGAVDGAILAKSATQADKEKVLNMIFASLKAKMIAKECIIITIEIK